MSDERDEAPGEDARHRPSRRRVLASSGLSALVGLGAGVAIPRPGGDGDGPSGTAADGGADPVAAPAATVQLSSDEGAGRANAERINDALRRNGGSRVELPPGAFPLGAPIVIPHAPGAGIVGRGAGRTVLRRADDADLDAMVVSERWLDGSGFSQDPSVVADLTLDGASATQRAGLGHGVLLMTYRSIVLRVVVADVRGDAFHLANGDRDGRQIGNDAVENRFVDCEARRPGGHGLRAPYTEGPGRPGTTDTWVVRFICEQPGAGYIASDRAGGWKILGAQCYSLDPPTGMGHGIELRSCFGTTVADTNIDTWGARDGGRWAGLALHAVGPRPSTVVGNVFEQQASPTDGSVAVLLEAARGQEAGWSVVANAAADAGGAGLGFCEVRDAGGRHRGVLASNALTSASRDDQGQPPNEQVSGGVRRSEVPAYDGGGPFSAGLRVIGNEFNVGGRPPSGWWPPGARVDNDDVAASTPGGDDPVVGWLRVGGDDVDWRELRA